MINPEGVRHQIHGNVIQSTSRVLKEKVTFSDIAVASREWGTYPLLTFPELPDIDVLMVPRPEDEPLGVGESASVPSAAAIANAIFDATGVRFREPPFTPDRILKGLREAGFAEAAPREPLPLPSRRRRQPSRGAGSLRCSRRRSERLDRLAWPACRSAARLRRSRGPIARPGPRRRLSMAGRLPVSAAAFIAIRRRAASRWRAGAPSLRPSARSTRPTSRPDEATGIGTWSYPAFERAMREGVGRDGRHLFPAFPYTSFVKASEADLQALYAYLMAQPAVSAPNRPAELRAPFGLRPLMAVWNTMFLQAKPFETRPDRDANGIAARISSKGSAIAPPATRPATRSAPNSRAPIIWPAAKSRAGTRRRSTGRRPRRSPGPNRPISTTSATVFPQSMAQPAGPWRRSSPG